MFHNLDLEFTVCWRGKGLCLVRVRHRDSMSVGNQRHTMSAWQVQMARAEVKRVPWPKPDGRRMGDPHGHPWSDVCFVCSENTSKVQDHRDWVLSEGRREVGIWSSYGVEE